MTTQYVGTIVHADMHKPLEIGTRFTRWTVIGETFSKVISKKHRSACLCRCDCGVEKVISTDSLKHGASLSCGCLRKDTPGGFKHGGCGTRLYSLFRSMHSRCYLPYHKAFKNYGGKGVQVCDEWKNNFEAFRDWAHANGYADNLEIDRIDNSKGYEPGNCRWITHYENCRNMDKNVWIEAGAKRLILTDWVKLSPVGWSTIKKRIEKLGWTNEQAIFTPKRQKTPIPT